jgi:surfeit locus 1 family protein
MVSSVAEQRRSLLVPALASLVAFAILVSLGVWQLERRAWKEALIDRIEARAHGEPAAIPPESAWPTWSAAADEFRRVRVTGTFLHEAETPVHGLMSGQPGQPVQGYYLLTPLRLPDGALVVVNRGFVPSELLDPAKRPQSQPAGEVTVTGLVRAPEDHGWFLPADDPGKNQWFARDPAAIARVKGLARVAPFLIEADDTPNPGGWPKGGQTRLTIPNNHLQYALTWFALAIVLAAVRVRCERSRDEAAVLRLLGAGPAFVAIPSALAGA